MTSGRRVYMSTPETLLAVYHDELLKIMEEDPSLNVIGVDLQKENALPILEKAINLNTFQDKPVLYAGYMCGLLPAHPARVDSSVNDIARLGPMVGLAMVHPSNEMEMRMALRWASKRSGQTYVRITSMPWEASCSLPDGYVLSPGQGFFLKRGKAAVIIAYGPVMLTQALQAASILEEHGISVAVLNLPWLNFVLQKWFMDFVIAKYPAIVTIDDHSVLGGQGAMLERELQHCAGNRPRFHSFGVWGDLAVGEADEVLRRHRLDGESIADVLRTEFL